MTVAGGVPPRRELLPHQAPRRTKAAPIMRLTEDAGGGGSVAGVAVSQHLAGSDDAEVTKSCPSCGQVFTCRPRGVCWCLSLEYRPKRRGQPTEAGACVCPACRRMKHNG